ncbi:hypothetical protein METBISCDRAFT_28880 [Metschnikowia bicuspidata]|uniref:Uncharacterized protein n=1 Tax=Metschnikowia bicuspidata TaxID=27322 RepID=A0A4P9Z7R4_9ASCO|nr:hypothetical protein METBISCDRAFT_28880 [Metschnikowia bicuspidata]
MCDMDAAGGDPAFFGAISTAAHTRISRLMLHPNIICGVSADDERRDPLAWIMEACPGEDEGEEDVPVRCFHLSPEILLSLPDMLTSASDNDFSPSGPAQLPAQNTPDNPIPSQKADAAHTMRHHNPNVLSSAAAPALAAAPHDAAEITFLTVQFDPVLDPRWLRNAPFCLENNENATGCFCLHAEAPPDTAKEPATPHTGTDIDLYLCQLLIMKNEVEFTSFFVSASNSADGTLLPAEAERVRMTAEMAALQ